uniref:Uncharacterized protein n=1 Tax=Rhizophora mucronata TaxID=61149 RepID=A0A2P2KPT7_RHIMU
MVILIRRRRKCIFLLLQCPCYILINLSNVNEHEKTKK